MNNWLESLKVILKGAWIGGTMMIPGVSGGTMAIIMGIYDHLLSAVNSLLTNKEKRDLPDQILYRRRVGNPSGGKTIFSSPGNVPYAGYLVFPGGSGRRNPHDL